MRASRDLRRLAQALYYETVDADQLLPFVQRCSDRPELADHVREPFISGQNGYLDPEKFLSDSDQSSGHDSVRARLITHGMREDRRKGPGEVSVAMMAVILCTKVEKIVVEQSAVVNWILPEDLLMDCAALSKSKHSTPSRIPLSNLRTFAIQAASTTGPEMHDDPWCWENDSWLELLSGLPWINSIEVFDGDFPIWCSGQLRSNLRSLIIINTIIGADAHVICQILKCFPVLECLDLTVPPRRDLYLESTWSEIGQIVSRHGASLRKFRFDNTLNCTRSLFNVSKLHNLRYLAIPVDTLMDLDHEELSMKRGCVNKQTFDGNRHGFGSVHDIEDMWAENIPADSEAADQDNEEDNITRSILDGPDVPFCDLLPNRLQHLRILDGIYTEDVADNVDRQVRDLVLDLRFSALHDVQVRRKSGFTEHVKDIGWHVERRPFWNVMRRV